MIICFFYLLDKQKINMRFIRTITYLSFLILIISCGGNDKTSAPKDTPKKTEAAKSALIADDGSVSVKMNFQGSEKYELIVSTDEKLTQEMQGEKSKLTSCSRKARYSGSCHRFIRERSFKPPTE